MTRFFISLIAIALVITFAACDSTETFVGSANVSTQIRDLTTFTEVDVSNTIATEITFGTEQSLTVRANDNLQERINTRVQNGQLIIDLARGNYRNADITVFITVPTVSALTIRDAVDAKLSGFSGLSELNLDISDASELVVSDAVAGTLTATVSDASDLVAFGMEIINAEVIITDASDAELTVSGNLSGRVSDASTLRYRGNPSLGVEVSDASSLVDAN